MAAASRLALACAKRVHKRAAHRDHLAHGPISSAMSPHRGDACHARARHASRAANNC